MSPEWLEKVIEHEVTHYILQKTISDFTSAQLDNIELSQSTEQTIRQIFINHMFH